MRGDGQDALLELTERAKMAIIVDELGSYVCLGTMHLEGGEDIGAVGELMVEVVIGGGGRMCASLFQPFINGLVHHAGHSLVEITIKILAGVKISLVYPGSETCDSSRINSDGAIYCITEDGVGVMSEDKGGVWDIGEAVELVHYHSKAPVPFGARAKKRLRKDFRTALEGCSDDVSEPDGEASGTVAGADGEASVTVAD